MNLEKTTAKLEKTIKVQVNVNGKNDLADIDTIYFLAPNSSNRDLTISLKKKFKEAMFSIAMQAKKEGSQSPSAKAAEAPNLTKDEIIDIIELAKDFDIIAFLRIFCSLMEFVAFKDEAMKQRLIPSEIEKIDGDDLEGLAGKYIEDFFIGSWMKERK